MSRLAWSYWHLKQYELCDTTVQKILNCQQVDFAISEVCKEFAVVNKMCNHGAFLLFCNHFCMFLYAVIVKMFLCIECNEYRIILFYCS